MQNPSAHNKQQRAAIGRQFTDQNFTFANRDKARKAHTKKYAKK